MERSSPAQPGAGDGERSALAHLVDDPSSRKRFLKMVGGAGAVSAFGTLVAACGDTRPIGVTQRDPGTQAEFGPGDIGIVNYALFLEFIENDFYERIVKGDEVKTPRLRDAFKIVQSNEREHQRALKKTAEQMGRPISKPKSNFEKIFAGGERKILTFAATLENLGSSAYLGQASRVQDPMVLAAALSIHTVEARHAAAFNKLAGRDFTGSSPFKGMIPNGAFAQPMNMKQVLKQARPYFKGDIPQLQPPSP